jgi:hypothetical protein
MQLFNTTAYTCSTSGPVGIWIKIHLNPKVRILALFLEYCRKFDAIRTRLQRGSVIIAAFLIHDAMMEL